MGQAKPSRLTHAERIEKSHQALLDSAAILVADRGYHGVTTADIAEKAGYSREMVRVRFGSKLELMRVLLKDEYQEALGQILPDEGTGLARLSQLRVNSRKLALESPARLRAALVLSLEAAISVPELKIDVEPWMARYKDYLHKTLRLGIRDGSIRKVPVEKTAELLFLAIIGASYEFLRDREQKTIASPVALLLDYLQPNDNH